MSTVDAETIPPGVAPWTPTRERTLWLDARTGAGVDDDGIRVLAGGASPVELCERARAHRATRVMLTGPRPNPGWLLVPTPGWEPGAHFLDADLPVGRLRPLAGGRAVELRRAAEWFGDVSSPATARVAWQLLAEIWGRRMPGGGLWRSPGATGLDGWLRSIPRGSQPPEQLGEATAALVHATSPQHRVEFMRGADDDLLPARLPGLWYIDGRLMYASLLRELGTAPVTALTARQVEDWWASDPRAPFARARYRICATVPLGWARPGAFMVAAGPDVTDGYDVPRVGGQRVRTWCDSAELHLARRHGWQVDVLEGLLFTPGRPLDTWRDRILGARDDLDSATYRDVDAGVRAAVRVALRAILLHGIGAFASTGRDITRVVTNPMAYLGLGRPIRRGDVWVLRERMPLSPRMARLVHPEFASQVWARAHARILESPTAVRAMTAGAWHTRPGTVVGVRGDALYVTERPPWAAARCDDGRVGRLRVKGHLHGPLGAPASAHDLNGMRARAEQAGPRCPRCREQ